MNQAAQGFFVRFQAACLDVLVGGGCIIAASLAGGVILGSAGGAAAAILMGISYSLLDVLAGASAGKMLMNLHIRDIAGGDAGPRRLFARWAIKYAGFITLLLASLTPWRALNWVGLIAMAGFVAECLLALWPGSQALHDRLCRTAIFWDPQGVALVKGVSLWSAGSDAADDHPSENRNAPRLRRPATPGQESQAA